MKLWKHIFMIVPGIKKRKFFGILQLISLDIFENSGDKFQISLEELRNGEEIARCPSCSLIIRVIYNPEDFQEE